VDLSKEQRMRNPAAGSGRSGAGPAASRSAREGAGIEERDGLLLGPLRPPVLAPRAVLRGVAQIVPGSIHLEQLPALLLRAFGQRWFETGNISIYFQNATGETDAVRGLLRLPAAGVQNQQVECWLERADGLRVGEGTAAIGAPDRSSELRRRLGHRRPVGTLRMLADRAPGHRSGPIPVRIPLSAQQQRLARIPEPLEWFATRSPWGDPILSLSALVQALRVADAGFGKLRGGAAVGVCGAIELQYLRGPVFAEREYRCSGEILALGESRRSEYCWYESRLEDPQQREPVASMIMMLRYMKDASPLWSGPGAAPTPRSPAPPRNPARPRP
jgi:hypothetical protein